MLQLTSRHGSESRDAHPSIMKPIPKCSVIVVLVPCLRQSGILEEKPPTQHCMQYAYEYTIICCNERKLNMEILIFVTQFISALIGYVIYLIHSDP